MYRGEWVLQASGMTQLVKMLAAKLHVQSLDLHTESREVILTSYPLTSPHMPWHTCVSFYISYTHMHIQSINTCLHTDGVIYDREDSIQDEVQEPLSYKRRPFPAVSLPF